MIRKCCKCFVIVGEKAPFDNNAVTHTLCDLCLKESLEDLQSKRKKNDEQPNIIDSVPAL